MGQSDDARRRRIHMDRATHAVLGVDPRTSGSEDARQAQRFQIADVVRQLHDAGYDRMLMIEMLLAGAAFIGDNYGVSREQMAKVIVQISLADSRQLIIAPDR
jgi:hypothetical protein